MKGFVCLVAALLIFFVFTNALSAITSADLWFPGDVGSVWNYNVNSDKVQSSVVDEVKIKGFKYRIIKESRPFISKVNKLDSNQFDPFLTFRKNGYKVEGYGIDANNSFRESFLEGLEEGLKDVGGDEADINLDMQFTDEWVLLGSPEVGYQWTVMNVTIKVSVFGGPMIFGSFKILGIVTGNEIWKMEENESELEALVVRYTSEWNIDGEIDKSYLFTIWLVPKIGIVRVDGFIAGMLIDYQLIPLPQKVDSSGKMYATWAAVKKASK